MEVSNIKNRILVSKDTLLGGGLILYLLLANRFSIEVNFVLLVILSFINFFRTQKVFRTLFNVLSPLCLIFVVSLFSSFCYQAVRYDIVRDIVYFTKPIFAIAFGFYFSIRFRDYRILLKSIVILSFLMTIIHLANILIYADLKTWNISQIRYVGGKDSVLEAFGFILFVVFIRKSDLGLFGKSFSKWFVGLTLLSLFFYFSRTTVIALLFFYISFKGFSQITRKGLFYLLGVFVTLIAFMVWLQSMDLKRESTGIENFLYKIKMSPSEIFNADIDIKDHSQLWDKWRAYEAQRAFGTMEVEDSVLPYLSGMGLGSLVDLEFEAPLAGEKVQYIPHLHNGYVFVFFKSGIFGLLIMLVWLLYLYMFIYKKERFYVEQIGHRTISGLGLYLVFSTLVITGIYNKGILVSVILGLMLGMFQKVKNSAVMEIRQI